jgi:hypothetical protein
MPQFPYVISLLRNLTNYSIRARVRGHHSKYAELYEPSHPTGALRLTFAILEAFRAEASRRAQRSLVLLLPTLQDLTYHEETGVWVHQPLLDRLSRAGIPFIDYGPYLVTHHDRAFDAYFTPGGHYNELGDAVLSRMLATELEPRLRRALPANP